MKNDLVLGKDEKLAYIAEIHKKAVYFPAIVALIVALIFPLVLWLIFEEKISTGIVFALFICLAIFIWISAEINLKTSEFVVTNKRVAMKTGLINRISFENLLTKVEGVALEQSLLGRIMGYGTVIITGTGGAATRFPYIADAFEFRRAIQNQLEKLN